MKVKLHRIAIVVRDLEKAITFYEKLLNTKFHRTGEAVAKEAGVYVAAAWDAGVELVAPVPNCDHPSAIEIEGFLKTHGDSGIYAAGFSTDDLEAMHARAATVGVTPLLPTFKFTQKQHDEEFGGAFTRFEETIMKTYEEHGFQMAFNFIEEKK